MLTCVIFISSISIIYRTKVLLLITLLRVLSFHTVSMKYKVSVESPI